MPRFGVLEVKLKNRLLEDPNAVAIGVLHRHQHLSDNDHGHHKNHRQRQQHPKKPHKLPQLVGAKGYDEIAEATRPISFDAERQQVMDAMELSSPTRSVIQKVVQHTKENKCKQLAELPPVQLSRERRCIPIAPTIRIALNTHESKYIRDALTILQELTRTPNIGPLLVPYYRQLLPVLNMFKNKRRNLGDDMGFQQHKAKDIGEMIVDTLEILKRTGDPMRV
ncbi:tRNA uridine 5-carboxymethylaminomethyl modification enzyme mnmg, partial [Globisporangium splendens]